VEVMEDIFGVFVEGEPERHGFKGFNEWKQSK